MFTRTRIAAGSAVAGLVLTGAAALGGAFQPSPAEAARMSAVIQEQGQVAQVQPSPSPSPSRSGAGVKGDKQGHRGANLTPEQRQQRQEQYRNRLAANLGVTPERLTLAFRQTHIDMVNQAVTEGRLTRQRADEIIQRINSGQGFGSGQRGGARPTQ